MQGHADGGTMLACLGASRGCSERIVEYMAGNGTEEASRKNPMDGLTCQV